MNSLRGRLLAFLALWTGIALVLAWVFIAALLRDFVSGRFAAELDAVAVSLMGAASWQDGTLAVTPPGDPRFGTPLSGWYWQVAGDAEVLAKSDSLWTADLGPQGDAPAPEGAALERRHARFTASTASFALNPARGVVTAARRVRRTDDCFRAVPAPARVGRKGSRSDPAYSAHWSMPSSYSTGSGIVPF